MTETDCLYVSLHIPKTGGSSFRQVLEQKFGERLLCVYGERKSWSILTDPACIHGHGVFKYFINTIDACSEAKWLTFLRDPFCGAISSYFFGKRRHSKLGERAPFTDRGLETWLTHTEPFCFPDPPGYNHNRYAKWFEKRPMAQYDFVGIMEAFDESLVVLYDLFRWPSLYYRKENVGGYDPPQLADSVVARFRELNAADYTIYDSAVTALNEKKRLYGSDFEKDIAEFRIQLKEYQGREQSH